MNKEHSQKTDRYNPIARPSRYSEFLAGGRDTFPLILGGIPFGIVFGTLATSSGLSYVGTLAMSAFVFAGSSQFIALGLLAAGTGLPVIIMTTFVVNLRHLLYSVTLVPFVKHLPQHWKIFLGFWLTDEVFAIAVNRYRFDDYSAYKHWYHLGSAIFLYLNWQVCTFLGLTFGQLIPNASSWGLDFAMSATFIGIVVPYLNTRPMVATAVISSIVALLSYSIPNKLGLILAALSGIAAGVLVEARINRETTQNL